MGRVSLLVEANTSIAIGNISKLGEAIKNAMAKFDSKALATWEKDAETKIGQVGTALQKLGESLQTFNNQLKADTSFGASKALATFKKNFEDSFQTLSNFKTYFKDGYTFGATTQVETFKTKINEAKLAVESLNKKVAENANVGANQALKGKRDEIAKMLSYVEALNRRLAVRPVVGAKEAISDFQAGLQNLSRNIGTYLSPMFISLNAVKTQMGELTQVLNSVQQPTWVEPFKAKMQEVVKVLQDIATAYKSVRGELKQSVGESPIRREFKLSSSQAESLLRTTTAFYSRIKKEFRETRAAATETARAIREAMAAVQGGGTGAGGTGTATAGTRLGFGEQLFSRMRSNLFSYMTMWFGVAGAIRMANGILEEHNMLLEKGREYNKQGYDALGELYLKAGSKARGDEYAEFSRQLAREGNFASNESAYNFASFALMSGLSKEDMRDLAPIFRAKVAKESDQRALMSAISYIKAQYGDQYSAKQISAMILEANLHGPSDIGPTANAVQDVIEIGKALNIPLPDLIALIGAGSGLNKDQRVKTAIRAYLSKIREKGLEPVIMAESMGMGAGAYYQDKKTGFYKFTDPEMQKQFEADVAAGREVVNMEMLMQLPAGRGRDIVREIGGGIRAGTGAMIMGNMGKNPENFNKIQAAIWAVANGDTSKMDEAIEAAQMVTGSAAEITAQGVSNTAGQLMSDEAAMEKSYVSLRALYDSRYNKSIFHNLHKIFNEGRFLGAASESGGINSFERLQARGVWVQNAFDYLESIQKDSKFTEEEKKLAEDAFLNMIRGVIEMYAKENSIDTSTPEGVKQAAAYLGWTTIAGGVMPTQDIEKAKRMAGYVTRARDISIQAVTPSSTPEPTATARAVKAASGTKTENAYLVEQDRLKEEKEKARYAQAFLDALPKWSIRTKENEFIKTAYLNVSSDMSADLQALKPYALGSEIGAKSDSNKVLSKAFYAYASDMTDAATDKEIVKQMVGAMLAAGMNKEGIGNLVNAYWEEMRLNNAVNIRSEDNRNAINNFQQAVLELLSSLNDEAKKGNEPPVNPAASRPAPATATR